MINAKIAASLVAVDKMTRVVRRANQSLNPLKIRADETTRAFRRLSRETGLSQLARTLRRAAGPMNRLGAAARGAAGPLGLITGGGAVVGLGALTMGYARAGDEAAKFGRIVGLSTESVQAFRFAAGRQGATTETLNMGLRTLSRVMGELRVGTGELNSFLERTSPSLLNALKNANGTEEAFLQLSQAVADTEDPFLRSKLAAAAFGESGQNLLNLLEGGPAGIAELRREFEALGGAIGNEAAKDAEAFQDSMANLNVAVGGLRNAIGSQLLPILTPMIAALTGWIAANRELIAQKVGAFMTSMSEIVQKIDFETIQIAAGAFAAVLSGPLISGVFGVIGTIGKLSAVLVTNPILLLAAGLGTAAFLVIRNWDKVGVFFSDLWDSIGAGIDWLRGALRGLLDSDVMKSMRAMADTVGGLVSRAADFLGFGDDREPALAGIRGGGAPPLDSRSSVEVRIRGENLPEGTQLSARSNGPVETDLQTNDALSLMYP